MSKGHKAGVWPLESEPRSPKFQWDLQASSVLSTSVFALAVVFFPSGTKSSASPHWVSDCPQSQHHFSAGFPGAGRIDSQIRALQTLFSVLRGHSSRTPDSYPDLPGRSLLSVKAAAYTASCPRGFQGSGLGCSWRPFFIRPSLPFLLVPVST